MSLNSPQQGSVEVPNHHENNISNSLIEFDPETECIDKWISRLKPSKVASSIDGVKYLLVNNPCENISEHAFCKEEYTKYLDLITDAKLHESNNPSAFTDAKEKCLQGIMDVARKQEYTRGYWMLYEDSVNIDAAWSKVAKETHDGKLGCSAKVCINRSKDGGFHIFIFARDFTDATSVKNILKAILMMGLEVRSSFSTKTGFKPDVYTSLGINTRNKWNLKPTLYHELLEVTSHPKDENNNRREKDVNTQFKLIKHKVSSTAVTGDKVSPRSQHSSATIVFCFNISPKVTEAELYSLFSNYGQITRVDLKDTKGYAFIHMPDPFQAYEAMMALNGFFYKGKVMQVSAKR